MKNKNQIKFCLIYQYNLEQILIILRVHLCFFCPMSSHCGLFVRSPLCRSAPVCRLGPRSLQRRHRTRVSVISPLDTPRCVLIAKHKQRLLPTWLGDLEELLSAVLLQPLFDLRHGLPGGGEGEVWVHRHPGDEAVVRRRAEVVEILHRLIKSNTRLVKQRDRNLCEWRACDFSNMINDRRLTSDTDVKY